MRMWMVNPKLMCSQHLLGEHVELHMLMGSLRRRKSLDGFFENGLIEPQSIYTRHNELVLEMQDRGFSHKSPIAEADVKEFSAYLPKKQLNFKINCKSSYDDLLARCQACRDRVGMKE